MKKIQVGAKREFKDINQALYNLGNKDLHIIVDEGEYGQTLLPGSNSIVIEGIGRVVLQAADYLIHTKNAKKITIKNLILVKATKTAMNFETSSQITVSNCFVFNSLGGIILNDCIDCTVENSTIIYNTNYNIFDDSQTTIKLINNVIAKSKFGLYKNKMSEIISSNNLCFQNTVNLTNTSNQGFLSDIQQFEDESNRDYRILDPKYRTLGASHDLLLSFATKRNTNLEKVNAIIHKNIKITFFLNFSVQNLYNEFKNIIETSKIRDIFTNIRYTNKNDITAENTEIVFFINGYDTIEEEHIDSVIDSAIANINYVYIYLPSEKTNVNLSQINLEKLPLVKSIHQEIQKKYSSVVKHYNDFNEAIDSIYNQASNKKPIIKVESLLLNNIGGFDTLEINFNSEVNCLIGLNGSGKTTVLRAIALGLIGFKHFSPEEKSQIVYSLLKIKGIDKYEQMARQNGSIEVAFTVSGYDFRNRVELLYNQTGSPEIKSNSDFVIVDASITKSLILGFTQMRSSYFDRNTKPQKSSTILPNVNDLRALIMNEDDKRLKVFGEWISVLDYNAMVAKQANAAPDFVPKEQKVLELTFEIISEITHDKINYLRRKRDDTADIWIQTFENPEGITLSLASQGYKDLIGWIGCFIERMSEAYPDEDDITQMPAIVMIDEIDSYMHPRWQSYLLKVLGNKFINTQFIVTTHSPFIIEGLLENQVICIEDHKKVEYNSVDIKGWQYGDIIRHFFKQEIDFKLFDVDVLKKKAEEFKANDNEEEAQKMEVQIQRIEMAKWAADGIKDLKLNLEKREKELLQLINEVKSKKN